MNNSINYLVDVSNDKKRLDLFLCNKINKLTRSNIKKIIEAGNVFINQIIIKAPSRKVRFNDSIKVIFSIPNSTKKIKPKKIKLLIVYEDEDIIIIDKPKGMVVHPGAGNYENTMVNALIYKYKKLSSLNGEQRPGIVHRIDKSTSGLLVVAKNNTSHASLGKQFSEHSIERTYLCLVWGVLRPLNGRIETLIRRNKKNRKIMSVSEIGGKKAITNYKTIKTFYSKDIPKISLVECKLETGRTHQIRVHLSHKGSSILGDFQYGKKNLKFKKINSDFLTNLKKFNGQALHAQTLGFIHPTKNIRLNFKSNLPSDFKDMLKLLENLSS